MYRGRVWRCRQTGREFNGNGSAFDAPRFAGLRALSLIPTVLVVGAYEHTHAFGGQLPIPFLSMFASVVVAAVVGGRLIGVVAAGLTAIEIVHAYFLGIGPAALTHTRGSETYPEEHLARRTLPSRHNALYSSSTCSPWRMRRIA